MSLVRPDVQTTAFLGCCMSTGFLFVFEAPPPQVSHLKLIPQSQFMALHMRKQLDETYT